MGDVYKNTITVQKCVELCMESVKRETGIDDETLISTWIERAYMSICNYLWCDALPRRLVPAAGALASALTMNGQQATTGRLASKTQGARSESYSYGNLADLDEYGLTSAVRAMLPPPRLRCF